jgi:hypothetical protein
MKRAWAVLGTLVLAGSAWSLEGVSEWIQRLKDEDPAVREQAIERLKGAGEAARPALEEAAKSDDAEVAHQAKRLLERLGDGADERKEEEKPRAPRRGPMVRGTSVRLIMGPNGDQTRIEETAGGAVKVVVRKDGEETKYEADSREAFSEKYPDVARKYGLDKEDGGLRVLGPDDPDLERLRKIDEQLERRLEETLRRLREGQEKGEWDEALEEALGGTGRKLGVDIDIVSEALRYQLDLPEGGMLVRRVTPASRAERLGIRRWDVLLSLNGRAISNASDVSRALEEEGAATAEVIRGGERMALKEAR